VTCRAWLHLKRRQDFLGVAASGLKRATPGCVVQARPAITDDVRIGFTASRKVGIAVARNRAKRRLRAAVDRVLPSLALKGWDFVLIARTDTLSRDFAVMADDLTRALAAVTRPGAARKPTWKPGRG
jgi:ribonuclease P protein component